MIYDTKKLRRVWISMLLSFVLLAQGGAAAARSELWDGYPIQEAAAVDVVDFNSLSTFMNDSTGTAMSRIHTKEHQFSAYWCHANSLSVSFNKVVRDWSAYDLLDIWVYAENADQKQFYMQAVCDQMEPAGASYLGQTFTVREGWNQFKLGIDTLGVYRSADPAKVQQLRFTVDGWSMTPSPESQFYFASVMLEKNDTGSLEQIYSPGDIASVVEALQGTAAVYAGSPVVVQNGERKITDQTVNGYAVERSGAVLVPLSFFQDYLGAEVREDDSSAVIRMGEKQVEVRLSGGGYQLAAENRVIDEEPVRENGTWYLPAAETAELLGLHTLTAGKMVLIGAEAAVRRFAPGGGVNIDYEILSYMASYVSVEPDEIQQSDFDLVKGRWRYSLVGDENNPADNARLAEKIRAIEETGRASWEKMKKNAAGLFGEKAPAATSEMTNEFQNLKNMALAYATFGSSLYHDPSLKLDILFGLDYMRDHRYGTAELNGTGWRATGDYNWWDWWIGSPSKLIDTLMVMEPELTKNQIDGYLVLFDTLCKSPAAHGNGSNQFNIAKEMMGSALLQGDAKKVIKMRDALDDMFLYSDNGRADGMGYFTDGTYRYHANHVLNGTYGLEHVRLAADVASLLAGTRFAYTNPQVYNTLDWLNNGILPLTYRGNMMSFTMGRFPMNGTAVSVMEAILSLTGLASGAGEEEIKAAALKQYQEDPDTNYFASLSLAGALRLDNILGDTQEKRAEANERQNKFYSSGDKAVYRTPEYTMGLSMSSSRVYNYEAFQNSNKTGWYQGDGMTLLYDRHTPVYDAAYWSGVDPYRLPGTTVDNQERKALNIATGNEYLSGKDFVGGVSDGIDGIAAMWLESYHNDRDFGTDMGEYGTKNPAHACSLEAQKAWFMFGGDVAALGSGITAQDGAEVLTVVDNTRLVDTVTLEETRGVQPLTVQSVSASQSPEAENVPENTLDGDLNTKWAAEGEAVITWDLGSVRELGFVTLSFQNGAARQQIFDLEASQDGTHWTQVFSGRSSGETEEPEAYELKGTEGRYIRLCSHGATNSQWISLSTAAFYSPSPDGKMTVPEVKRIGRETVTNSLGKVVDTSDANLDGVKWVHLQNRGGYYFPQGGAIRARRRAAAASFFELWAEHGVDPDQETYAYILLPGRTEAETRAYAEAPRLEILQNTPKLQAVRHAGLGLTGMVFWEPGSFGSIAVTEPLIIMCRQRGDSLELQLSDPTQKLSSAEITIAGMTGLRESSGAIAGERTPEGIKLKIDFSGALGKTLGAVLD